MIGCKIEPKTKTLDLGKRRRRERIYRQPTWFSGKHRGRGKEVRRERYVVYTGNGKIETYSTMRS